MHLKNALRDIWLALYFFCDSATYTTLSIETSFVKLSMYVMNLYSKQHSKRKKKQKKTNQNKKLRGTTALQHQK